MPELSNILRPVEREMKEFHAEFRRAMISDVPLVNLVAKYLIRTKGKQLRPMLVLLSAKACGEVNEATYRAATLVELLHSATLIHDDVIDDSELRRGFASIKALWRNKVGVLMGDYLLAQGLLRTVKTGEYHFLEITSNAVRRMSEGELYQLQKARQLNIDEAAYFQIIADKTASLISTCCELGAASIPGHSFQESLKNYGEAIGIAFQIRDDLFGFESKNGMVGKPAESDLKEKKLTLPLIHSLSKTDNRTKKRIIALVKNGKAAKESYREVIDFVSSNGSIAYTRAKAEEYSQLAIESLMALPESESRAALEAFARYVIERDH
ncbi:MAG TPA: polyprenyl synthetase family protein [Candidatus Kapabacteria bacterium]|nr:polyprenyl synthetase family protein [Candidatus Kapabacteria bacterium]